MGTSFIRDKSLLSEGRVAGWYLDRPRAFAEPGATPVYGPDKEFALASLGLRLTIDPAEKSLVGEARLRIAPLSVGLGEVRLDLDELVVDSVESEEGSLDWRHSDGVLRIRGLQEETTVVVRYHGRPSRGLYFVGPDPAHPHRKVQAWTQCQDEDAHYVFPCVDHPSVKQPVQIEVRAPSDFEVVSNGRLESVEDLDGWKCWSWREEKPIPAYLVTVVVAHLDVHPDPSDSRLRYLVPEGTPAAQVERVFARTPKMLAFFQDTFGVDYPWSRYDQVVVDDFIFGGMENAGATTLTRLCLTDERAHEEWEGDALIAHELAHQWFGDLVTCQDWSQGWLNEGWATYSESLWQEYEKGDAMGAWTLWKIAEGYFAEPDGRYCRPIVSYLFREPIDLFDRHLYNKAGCVLHTLRMELGDAHFWPGVKAYLEEHAYGTVHTRDFQKILERVTGRNLDGFFQQWIHSAGHPELTLKLSHEKSLLRVEVKQTQKGEGIPPVFRFGLRLGVVTDGVERTVDLSIGERECAFVIPLESPDYVRVDPGFRVLARMRIEAPQSWLIRALEGDACPIVRIRAAQSLAKRGGPTDLEALVEAATDSDWRIRISVAGLLGGLAGETSRVTLLKGLETEAHPRVRLAMVKALGKMRHPQVEERLGSIAEGDASLFAEAEAGAVLGRLQSPLAQRHCNSLLERASWGEVLVAGGLKGLGASRKPEVLETLLAHTEEHHPQRVRAAAAGALASLASDREACVPPALDRLLELTQTAGFRVRLAAVAALGRLREPRALSTLSALHASTGDGRLRRMAYEAIQDIRDGRTSSQALGELRQTVEELERKQAGLRDRLSSLEHQD